MIDSSAAQDNLVIAVAIGSAAHPGLAIAGAATLAISVALHWLPPVRFPPRL